MKISINGSSGVSTSKRRRPPLAARPAAANEVTAAAPLAADRSAPVAAGGTGAPGALVAKVRDDLVCVAAARAAIVGAAGEAGTRVRAAPKALAAAATVSLTGRSGARAPPASGRGGAGAAP